MQGRRTVKENGPHFVDVHVGMVVRVKRKLAGLSQSQLAERIGITFQQLQKYERGANRISASKLYEISRVLRAPIGEFFADLDQGDGQPPTDVSDAHAVQKFLGTSEGMELAGCFPKIVDARVRRKALELLKALSSPSVGEH